MKLTRTLGLGLGLIAISMLAAPSIVGRAQQAPAQAAAPRQPILNDNKLIMQPEEAATGGPVLGEASKPGIYVTRVRFAPGRGTRPHYHDQARYITVLKGTWWTGAGDVYQPDKMTAIKPGGFMYQPPGFHHYDTARDEEVVVQIIGMGPVKTVQSEVDEKGQPVSRGRGNPQ
jgi:quercetin dioxygenase-like cupin family protein